MTLLLGFAMGATVAPHRSTGPGAAVVYGYPRNSGDTVTARSDPAAGARGSQARRFSASTGVVDPQEAGPAQGTAPAPPRRARIASRGPTLSNYPRNPPDRARLRHAYACT